MQQKKKKNSRSRVKKRTARGPSSTKHKIECSKNVGKQAQSERKIHDNRALIVEQEIKFARLLASNDKKVRDKVLKNLKKWFTVRSQSSFGKICHHLNWRIIFKKIIFVIAFTEIDFMRIWKGLFYCMWMSDKMLVQEELAEFISKLVHCFTSLETALLYTKCTLKTLATEWFGIDHYRVDKFQMVSLCFSFFYWMQYSTIIIECLRFFINCNCIILACKKNFKTNFWNV